MRRILGVIATVAALLVGTVALAPPASADVLVVSDRYQVTGTPGANTFYDIRFDQYSSGIVQVVVNLYSNTPRVLYGEVFKAAVSDWAVPVLASSGTWAQPYGTFGFCPNLPNDRFYNYRQVPGLVQVTMSNGQFVGMDQWYNHIAGPEGFYTIRDYSRVEVEHIPNDACASVNLY